MVDRLLSRPWIVLVVALVVHTVLFLAMQRDLAASDPLWYASKANDLAFHASQLFTAHNTYPFVMRLGLTGPIAIMYRLFGVSTFATNLPCLLVGLAIMVVAYAAPSTPRGKLLAVLLAMVCTPLLADAHELNPDLPCAAAMAVSILCLARRDRARRAGDGWLARSGRRSVSASCLARGTWCSARCCGAIRWRASTASPRPR